MARLRFEYCNFQKAATSGRGIFKDVSINCYFYLRNLVMILFLIDFFNSFSGKNVRLKSRKKILISLDLQKKNIIFMY